MQAGAVHGRQVGQRRQRLLLRAHQRQGTLKTPPHRGCEGLPGNDAGKRGQHFKAGLAGINHVKQVTV